MTTQSSDISDSPPKAIEATRKGSRLLQRVFWRVRPSVRKWIPFASVTLGYFLLSYLAGWAVGWRGPVFDVSVLLVWAVLGVMLVVACAIVFSVSRGAGTALAHTGQVAIRFAVIAGAANLLVALLTGWRVSIPLVHPFSWDRTFHDWDLALHGVEPWRVTHALLHLAAVRAWLPAAIDWSYSLAWLAANVFVVLILAIAPVNARGQRVLVAFVLGYAILGSLAAIVFSSAGPVYYGRVVAGPDPYAELVPSLTRHLPTFAAGATQLQSYLWHLYTVGDIKHTTGITAFPSMHVSSSTLLALALGSWNRSAGVVGWVGVALTLLGSVYLGWHYAVDGYAAVSGMLVLWWIAGWMTGDRPDSRD